MTGARWFDLKVGWRETRCPTDRQLRLIARRLVRRWQVRQRGSISHASMTTENL
jgi:hypothetical protein